MRSILASCSCRIGALSRIIIALLIVRYVTNFLYMYDGLTGLSSTTHKSSMAVSLEKQLLVALDPKLSIVERMEKKVEIVDTTSWAQPSRRYMIDSTDLWETENNSNLLPRWMINYFRWHKEQTLNGHDITGQLRTKYLYVTCFKEYHKCGGTADRLLR